MRSITTAICFICLLPCLIWATDYCTDTTLFKLTKNRIQEKYPELLVKLDTHAELSAEEKLLLENEMTKSANEVREQIFTFFKQKSVEGLNNVQGCVDYSMATAYTIEKGGISPEIAVEKTLSTRPLEVRELPPMLRYGARADNDISIFWIKDDNGIVRFNGQTLSDESQMLLKYMSAKTYVSKIKSPYVNDYLVTLLPRSDADLLTKPSLPEQVIEQALPKMNKGDVGILIGHYKPKTTLDGISKQINHAIAVQKISDAKWIIFDNLAESAQIKRIPTTGDELEAVFTSNIEPLIQQDNKDLAYLKTLKDSPDALDQIAYELGLNVIEKSPMGRLLEDGEEITGFDFSNLRIITKSK